MLHFVPFHARTSVAALLRSWLEEMPTATQWVEDVHVTALRALANQPEGFGLFWIVQAVPSQRSTSVVTLVVPFWTKTTAVHAFGPLQATALKPAPVEPCGFGEAWIDHFVPFQFSTKVANTPDTSEVPTA
jgi:hypothetical protein